VPERAHAEKRSRPGRTARVLITALGTMEGQHRGI
jgi:hypothetical protein